MKLETLLEGHQVYHGGCLQIYTAESGFYATGLKMRPVERHSFREMIKHREDFIRNAEVLKKTASVYVTGRYSEPDPDPDDDPDEAPFEAWYELDIVSRKALTTEQKQQLVQLCKEKLSEILVRNGVLNPSET